MSQDMTQEESQNIFQSMGFAGGTFITVGVVDVLGRFGPTGLVVGAIGSYFSYHYGPRWYAAAMRQYDNLDPKSKAAIQLALRRFRHDIPDDESVNEVVAQPKLDEETQARAQAVKEAFEEEMEALPENPCVRVNRKGMIDLADGLNIDIRDIAGKAIFVCGIRRHGKTTLGARLAEQMGRQYIPMLIPDLEGDYLSLADILPRAIIAGPSSADAQYEDYDFVGLDAPEQAFDLGYDLLDRGYQIILDMVSYEKLDDAVNIQVNLIKGMFKWANDHPDKRVPSAVYLDEAQRFLPQTLSDSVIQDKGLVQELLKAYMDIIAIGGKRGISPLILTQRFAQVNNKIMAQSEVFFLLRQTHDTDLKRCMEYADAPITAEQIKTFGKGEGIYIATDGTQIVTRFHQRESDGSRSKTPQPDAAQRYATMSMRPSSGASSTSVPTSQVSGVSTSVPTSRQEKKLRLVNGHEGSPEVARSGFETEKSSEVDAPRNFELTEREIRMGEMFFVECVGINVIMKEFFPGITGGDRYQKASAEINDALRNYVEAKRGA